MNLYPLLRLLVFSPLISSATAPVSFPMREHREVGAFVITYSAGDEAYAEELARRLPDFELPPVAADAGRVALSDLRQRRDEILRRISTILALSGPLPVMAGIYDGFLDNYAAVSEAVNSGVPRNYALWRRTEVHARLHAGQQISGFTLRPPDEVYFALQFHFTFNNGALGEPLVDPAAARAQAAKAWAELEVPLPIATDPARSPEEDIAELLVDAGKMLAAMRAGGPGSVASPFTVLHETTEAAIVQHYLTSVDRRWFCDGVANYVAWKVLADMFGAEAARQYYDLDAQLKMYAAEAPNIDLERWPASEHLAQKNYSEALDTASYAFATKVIADINVKYGDSVLPRLFAELGRTPRENATMKAVYRAFRRVTGEDLKRYLPRTHGKAG